MVGQEEISWAERAASTTYVYLPVEETNQGNNNNMLDLSNVDNTQFDLASFSDIVNQTGDTPNALIPQVD